MYRGQPLSTAIKETLKKINNVTPEPIQRIRPMGGRLTIDPVNPGIQMPLVICHYIAGVLFIPDNSVDAERSVAQYTLTNALQHQGFTGHNLARHIITAHNLLKTNKNLHYKLHLI